MDERLISRRFNVALSKEETADGRSLNDVRRDAEEDEEYLLRKAASPMDVKDAIKRILLAKKDRDFFRLLELPLPEMDDLDRVTWNVSSAEVSKAYRRLSVLVHPDKNPGNDAREAFEALNEAHRHLRDRGGLEEMLNKQAEAARKRREAAEASATPEERVILYAAKQERAKLLQKQEQAERQAAVIRQMEARQLEARRKREMRSSYRKEEEGTDLEKDGEDDDEQQEGERLDIKKASRAKSKSKKPRLIF